MNALIALALLTQVAPESSVGDPPTLRYDAAVADPFPARHVPGAWRVHRATGTKPTPPPKADDAPAAAEPPAESPKPPAVSAPDVFTGDDLAAILERLGRLEETVRGLTLRLVSAPAKAAPPAEKDCVCCGKGCRCQKRGDCGHPACACEAGEHRVILGENPVTFEVPTDGRPGRLAPKAEAGRKARAEAEAGPGCACCGLECSCLSPGDCGHADCDCRHGRKASATTPPTGLRRAADGTATVLRDRFGKEWSSDPLGDDNLLRWVAYRNALPVATVPIDSPSGPYAPTFGAAPPMLYGAFSPAARLFSPGAGFFSTGGFSAGSVCGPGGCGPAGGFGGFRLFGGHGFR